MKENNKKKSTNNYFQNYYLRNQDIIKTRSIKRYEENKEQVKRTTAEYRKSDEYKAIKKECDRRIHAQRKQSSIKSANDGKLGLEYSDIEDNIIILNKELHKKPYRVTADELSRSMKGIEYRYNLLRKKREAGDESIPCYL